MAQHNSDEIPAWVGPAVRHPPGGLPIQAGDDGVYPPPPLDGAVDSGTTADQGYAPGPPALRPPALGPPPPPPRQTGGPPGPEEPSVGRPVGLNQDLPPGPDELDEGSVLRPRADRPTEGWRATLYRITGGAVNLGPGRNEQAWDNLVRRCQAPCPTGRRIAIISRKGGVGKTTTTLMIGHTLAAVRPDRTMAIDGNPDAGTLAYRVTRQTDSSVIDAVARQGAINGYPDARRLTSQAPSRLEVLASPQDPHSSRALRGKDYQQVMDDLDKHYNVLLCDTGTGIMDNANLGILDAIDQIVLVSGMALDSARAASMTLDWLDTNGRADLVGDAVVVINSVTDRGRVDVDQIVRHFADRCRSVHRIPHDQHLEAGAVTDPDRLAPKTQQAWLEVAAAVVDGFSLPSGRNRRS